MDQIFLWLIVGLCIIAGIYFVYRSRSARKGLDAVSDCMTGVGYASKVIAQVMLWAYFAPYKVAAHRQRHWWIFLVCSLLKVLTAFLFWKYLSKSISILWSFSVISWENVVSFLLLPFVDFAIGLIIQLGVKRKYPINTYLEEILKGQSYWGFILKKLKHWS
jgi:hypothetical protein